MGPLPKEPTTYKQPHVERRRPTSPNQTLHNSQSPKISLYRRLLLPSPEDQLMAQIAGNKDEILGGGKDTTSCAVVDCGVVRGL
jgi:hypothetical protein